MDNAGVMNWQNPKQQGAISNKKTKITKRTTSSNQKTNSLITIRVCLSDNIDQYLLITNVISLELGWRAVHTWHTAVLTDTAGQIIYCRLSASRWFGSCVLATRKEEEHLPGSTEYRKRDTERQTIHSNWARGGATAKTVTLESI